MAGLTRYPVKSLAGEELAVVEVGPRGLAGDRGWAVHTEDGGIGSGKTTRRFRRVDGLLELRARLAGAVPVVDFPSGPLTADDAAANQTLSTVLGRPLELRPEGEVPHHDQSPVHVITSAALRSLGRVLGRILRALADGRDLTFGVQASVLRGGTIRRGDSAVLL
ncbi:MOSC N-terminal beta barrel domain-containing protein [Blastococcus mobilis]|uniref:MOSC N-terminal beta barrel domain-containing protein n=1 Tax=Blastococcus mobilis TaxID=1938746 RepID=UPI000B77E6CD|nr:MOSC N-terminal beta barrel domain-containing protein [Blastococcus mobilis]